jgi:hypothetical protein
LFKKAGNFMVRKEREIPGLRQDRRIEPGPEILAQPEASRRPDFFRVN